MFRVYRALDEIGPEARGCALTIGNFDGVHVGHRRIFRRVVELGREHGWTPSVLTFDPHPTKVVAPDRAPKLLTTTEERLEYMRAEGIEQVFRPVLRPRVFRAEPGSIRPRHTGGAPGRQRSSGGRQFPFRQGAGRQRGVAAPVWARSTGS